MIRVLILSALLGLALECGVASYAAGMARDTLQGVADAIAQVNR